MEFASEAEKRLATMINSERASADLPELKIAVNLNASAQSHSDWMADTGTLSHVGAGGTGSADRIEESGFPLEGSWKTSENVAYTTTNGDVDEDELERMHRGLMESDGHRANILDPDVSFVGIGLAVGDVSVGGSSQEAVFLTQNFAATDGQVTVEEVTDGATVLQDYEDGEPVGAAEAVADQSEVAQDDEEEDSEEDDREDDESDSGGGCFVATAAYGDRLHPEVVELRRYRDRVLSKSGTGRALIRTYALLGPRIARRVSHDRVSGRLARAAISPLARFIAVYRNRKE